MSEALDLFDDNLPTGTEDQTSVVQKMTESQRESIKRSFAELGIASAREQFAVVREITSQHITSVGQLESRYAQTLIYGLDEKVRLSGRKNTGRAWDDREEDTWIDKL